MTKKDKRKARDPHREDNPSSSSGIWSVPEEVWEELAPLVQLAKNVGALTITSTTEALSLAVLQAPGQAGVEIAVGEAQSFGIPPAFGGPYLGFMATRDEYKRHLPGRIVGQTVDLEGQPGFVLTLSTREQHIRRERATSNICTNQNLIMILATMHLTLLGRQGLQEVARHNITKTAYFKAELAKLPRWKLQFSGPVFNELVITGPRPAQEVIQDCLTHDVLPGMDLERHHPALKQSLLVCVTEIKKREDIDRLIQCLARQ